MEKRAHLPLWHRSGYQPEGEQALMRSWSGVPQEGEESQVLAG